MIIEESDLAERVKPATMRITAEVVQRLQFSEDGDVDGSAESVLEIIQSGDFIAQQKRAQCIGAEGSWSHNVIVPIGTNLLIGTITNLADLGHRISVCGSAGLYKHFKPKLACCRSSLVEPSYDREPINCELLFLRRPIAV